MEPRNNDLLKEINKTEAKNRKALVGLGFCNYAAVLVKHITSKQYRDNCIALSDKLDYAVTIDNLNAEHEQLMNNTGELANG